MKTLREHAGQKPPVIYWKPIVIVAVVCAVFVGGFIVVICRAQAIFKTGPVRAAVVKASASDGATPGSEPVVNGSDAQLDSAPTTTQDSPAPDPIAPVNVDASRDAGTGDCKACGAKPLAAGARVGPAGGTYGTAVDFVDDPAEAARLALKDKKLLFVLHIAGNFEDDAFT